ncbi:MAG: 2-hydroxyacid dehydrogenase [Erysipelotrichia bacterium]|nr:2-hydroxyacid dehydrogenase [Erysipelotrichia bacterium]
MKIAFFDSKPYDISSFIQYKDENLEFKFYETRLNIDTVALAAGSDAICIFVNDTCNAEIIDRLVQYGIKLIVLRCAGYNNVDINYCYKKIRVMHVPAYSPYAVSEHAMALLLTSVRRIHKAYNRVRDFNFSLNDLTGFDLHNKTIGVIGTGKIGKCFIEICRGFGMNIIAYDPFPNGEYNYVSLENLFENSDIISLHCPLTDDTFHLINTHSIDKMKKGVIIINTSRGALIDSNALLDGIKSRKIGAACLDVYEEEADIFYHDNSNHILNDDTLARLISMPNVIITSHQAYLTREALDNIAQTTIKNIYAFKNGEFSENELCYHCPKIEYCKGKRDKKCF